MKNEIFIQVHDNEIRTDDILKKIKEKWKAEGKLVKELKDVKVYYNIKEETIYVIINDSDHMIINQREVEIIE